MKINLSLSTFVSALFGVGGPLCLAVGAANLGALSTPIDAVITSVGGLVTALAAHHAFGVSAAKASAPKA